MYECPFCRKPNKRLVKKREAELAEVVKCREIAKRFKYYMKKYHNSSNFIEHFNDFIGKFDGYSPVEVMKLFYRESELMSASNRDKLRALLIKRYGRAFIPDAYDSDSDDE